MKSKAQASTEYLLLIAGAILVAVLAIGLLLQFVPPIVGEIALNSAQAKCSSLSQNTCSQSPQVLFLGKTFTCIWKEPEKKCVAQEQTTPPGQTTLCRTNGTLNPMAECDENFFPDGENCTAYERLPGEHYSSGTIVCDTQTCSINFGDCGYCGNYRLDQGEDCDGTAVITQTCPGQTQLAGCLDCGFDYTNCPAPSTTCNQNTGLCMQECHAPAQPVESTDCSAGKVCCVVSNYCGNGVCEPSFGETNESCLADCHCGNSETEADLGEQCDDGNTTPSDGCSDSCQTEPNWVCEGQPSACYQQNVCGNGEIEPQNNEKCDCGFDNACSQAELDNQTCQTLRPGLYSGGELECNADCTDFDTTQCTLAPQEIQLNGQPFFGMQIESVTISPDNSQVTVQTTGAKYVLTKNFSNSGKSRLSMQSRIDPRTNDYYSASNSDNKEVAVLEFDSDLGAFSVGDCDRQSCLIDSQNTGFKFNSDSFFILTSKKDNFSYSHENLISNAVWNKIGDQDGNIKYTADHIWTDGHGGSLHASLAQNWDVPGRPTATVLNSNKTGFVMKNGQKMAHMVFPPKKFDFEKLYGQNSKPFVQFLNAADLTTNFDFDKYSSRGFGVFALFNSIYSSSGLSPNSDNYCLPNVTFCKSDGGECGHCPAKLTGGQIGYKIKPELDAKVRDFIRKAHEKGFKVITYLYSPGENAWKEATGNDNPKTPSDTQSIQTTMQWMRSFQSEYNFNGWLFDNANVWDLSYDYDFMHQIRKDIGDDGIIFHHDSVDVWDSPHSGGYLFSGLRAIMVNAYVDYTLAGEVGPMAIVNSPNDTYLRFFTSGYGLSQAIGVHKLSSDGLSRLSLPELNRALAENLNGIQRNLDYYWINFFKPRYDVRKSCYLARNSTCKFNPDDTCTPQLPCAWG